MLLPSQGKSILFSFPKNHSWTHEQWWTLTNKIGCTLRGRIRGQNPDKSLQSFPPCYSQTPLQLYPEISISSNSCNLLHISSNSCNLLHIFSNSRKLKSISSNSHNLLSISTVQLLYTKKEKGGKPYPLPYGLRNPYWNLTFEKEIVRSWIRLLLTGAKLSISALSFCLSGFSSEIVAS